MASYFWINGRMNRLEWWAGTLCSTVLCIIVAVAAGYGGDPESMPASLAVIVLGVTAAMMWFNVCITIQRFHDRNKSGLWFFIGLIPVIGSLWILIECGFLRGSSGPNEYGDPAGSLSADALTAEIDGLRRGRSQAMRQVNSAGSMQRAAANTGNPGPGVGRTRGGFGRRGQNALH
ncbi:MAG: DUF805 domain-containing protein [Alphaproteobacteria bacterium]|nr:DUF805 domain-containing protein [Alphaproteobacteria bacterium]